jgi:hypothetical protein
MRVLARLSRALAPPPIGPDTLVPERHRAFIRSLPCLACGRPAPSECAAIGARTEAGTGLQPTARLIVPLCGPPTVWEDCCHSRLYYRGRTRFWSELGIDPLALAARLWRVSGDREAGVHAVMRARQARVLHRGEVREARS